jgi:hypothetical protein
MVRLDVSQNEVRLWQRQIVNKIAQFETRNILVHEIFDKGYDMPETGGSPNMAIKVIGSQKKDILPLTTDSTAGSETKLMQQARMSYIQL